MARLDQSFVLVLLDGAGEPWGGGGGGWVEGGGWRGRWNERTPPSVRR